MFCQSKIPHNGTFLSMGASIAEIGIGVNRFWPIFTLLFVEKPLFYWVFLAFGVTQKPIYFPSIKRVWASKPGIAPKTMIVTNMRGH